ncbi:MAG TPA: hypothetical protein VG759_22940 [Candidatus Angelobacter sp.]|jgi:RNA polymerase sigma-70 factor (ECF subfamily)|nr:hypothetical protein [Candidatus Angelobacter sp.]
MKDFDGSDFGKDYVQKLRAGDKDTESHFVAHFGALLHIRLRRRLASNGDVEIVRNRVLSEMLAAIRSETGLDHARHLTALVSKVCGDVLREFQNRLAPLSLPVGSAGHPAGDRNTKSDVWLKNLVRQVLAGFSPKEQQLLRAVLADNRRSEDACNEVGLSRDRLPLLLFRAKRKFLEQYKREKGLN